jgi:FMN-dependent NADH-azoreductase
MPTLLQLDSSLFSDRGASSQLARDFVTAWQRSHPGTRVIRRDLALNPIPHLDQERFLALSTPPNERTPEQAEIARESDTLVSELKAADTVVLGLPMYNFGVPSTLKAYFDHVARAGVTFRYTPQGSEGLLSGTAVYVLAARGGRYQGSALDSQTRYVTDFFQFLGMGPVEFIYAEGLAMGEDHREQALDQARHALQARAA